MDFAPKIELCDRTKAVAYAKRIQLYPLSQAAHPPATTFVDAIDIVYDSTIPYDLRFFQSLDRVVQREPWLARDRLMIDILKLIGIEKGKPFNPDATTQGILTSAAGEAHALLESRYEGIFTPYFDSSRWALPALPDYVKAAQDGFADPTAYPFDSRGLVFTFAFFSPKHLGEGQFYLMTVEGQGWTAFRRQQEISPDRARERAGKPSTGRRRFMTAPPTASPGACPGPGRGSQRPGPAQERRRLGGHLFRPQGSRRQGVELGADEPERTLRSALPLLRSRKAAVREDVEAAGH